MEEGPQPGHALRFGLFEADLEAGQLRKDGVRVKLPQQPFQVLVCLLEGSGRVVTREALIAELWPNGTVVEYEHSLGTAINKIRQALGDSADNPEFVETLPRRGYRFLVPVERIGRPREEHPPQVAALAPEPGATISHYKITEKLGQGGMGVVYKAEDTNLKRPVALKFLAAHLLQDEESRQRFLREARAGAAINHPNICMVHEIGEADGQTFLAMEFVAGQGVKEKIETRPLKLEEALDIATQTAQGLQEAHEKGIVHRDIKPANLMVNEKGQVKIMDFGLAQLASRSKLTKTGTTLGTMAYMSPEQVQGEPTDHRSDIWSLGVVLYEMVTGQLPFKGDYGQVVGSNILNEEPEPITALRAGLPMELEWIVGKALAKDAAERYQHVEEIIVDLRSLHGKLVADVSIPTPAETADRRVMPQPTPQERLSRHHRVHRVLIAVSVLSISAAVAFGVLWWLRAPTPGGERPLRRFTLMPQESVFWPVVSPDGRFIAYLTKPSAETVALWVHNLSEDDARIIGGPDEAIWNTQPFWSPDSKILVFRSGNELKKIPVEGGLSLRSVRSGRVSDRLEVVGLPMVKRLCSPSLKGSGRSLQGAGCPDGGSKCAGKSAFSSDGHTSCLQKQVTANCCMSRSTKPETAKSWPMTSTKDSERTS